MAKRKISECCDLFTGFPLSTKDFVANGEKEVIQLRDMTKDGLVLDLKRSNISVANEEKYIRKGDVLFKSRGHSLEAHAIVFHGLEKTIVTNGFIVLRPFPEVLPRYLSWVLNNVNFDRVTQQTQMIKSVSIRDLRDIEIPMPEMARQTKIIEISDEIEKGKELADHYFYDAETYLRGSVFKS